MPAAVHARVCVCEMPGKPLISAPLCPPHPHPPPPPRPTGTGKSMIMDRALRSLDVCTHGSQFISLNHSHDGPTLQSALERQLEKKAGVHYGPRGSRRLVYWLDDASLPYMDKYGTQSALELVRQAIDYGGWYDKARAGAREVTGIGFAACVNPGAGSGTVGPKLQRHFVTLAVDPPTPVDSQCVPAGFVPRQRDWVWQGLPGA